MKKRRRREPAGRCPCGSGAFFGKCCGPFLEGGKAPATPVELMRSRYSAYARGDVKYIVETTDPEGGAWQEPLDKWREEIRSFCRSFRFEGVEILESMEEGEAGEVRFHARLTQDEKDCSFVERSQFVRRQGRWLYSDGDGEPKA